jgi:arsenate reductase
MVEGFLKSASKELQVFSAGIHPEDEVNSFAVKAMKEINIDISNQKPKAVENFANESFDFVITVCDYAREHCPKFSQKVNQRLHIAFDDPAKAQGTQEQILEVYRKTRDAIVDKFSEFLDNQFNR